jgi:hypothetical protein
MSRKKYSPDSWSCKNSQLPKVTIIIFMFLNIKINEHNLAFIPNFEALLNVHIYNNTIQ